MAMEFAETYVAHGLAHQKLTAPHRSETRTNDWEHVEHPLTVGQRARWVLAEMVGRSTAMERLFLQMRYLARHLRLALIEGEPGTGKRLAIETLHGLGAADRVANAPGTAALVVERASAFLAAKDQDMREALAQMRGGVLYLSHVDQLQPDEQVRLRQVASWLQRQGIHAGARLSLPFSSSGASAAPPAGPSSLPRALVAGSQRDLKSLVLRGEFRNDLYQQLASVRLLLPPLRDRAEDIPMLVQIFLAQRLRQGAASTGRCTHEALLDLLSYRWPGNLTELRAAVDQAAERACLRATNGSASAGSQRTPEAASAEAVPLLAEDFGLSLRAESVCIEEWAPQVGGDFSHEHAGEPQASMERAAKPLQAPRRGEFQVARSQSGSLSTGAASSRRTSPVVPWPTGGPEGRHRGVEPMSTGNIANAREAAVPRRSQQSTDLQSATSGASGWDAGSEEDFVPAQREPACRSLAAAQSAQNKASRVVLSPEALANLNLDQAILMHIDKVLSHAGGNKLRAARLLGISRSTLYRLLEGKTVPASVS